MPLPPSVRLCGVVMLLLSASLDLVQAATPNETQQAYQAAKNYFRQQSLSQKLNHINVTAERQLPPASKNPVEKSYYDDADSLSSRATNAVNTRDSIGNLLRDNTRQRPRVTIDTQSAETLFADTIQTHADGIVDGSDEHCKKTRWVKVNHKRIAEQIPCGEKVYCLNGDCETVDTEKNTGFGQSAARLDAVVLMGEDIRSQEIAPDKASHHAIRIFTGRRARCRDVTLGSMNCCRDDGWANGIAMRCNQEEQRLGRAKVQGGLVVSLGRYCSHRSWGVCLEHKQSYCIFPSRIARAVQVDGRLKQLHRRFGSAKRPDCSGLSIDEVQSLDFSRIDLSDAIEDVADQVRLPDHVSVQDKLEKKITQQLRQPGDFSQAGGDHAAW